MKNRRRTIAFRRIAMEALPHAETIVARWLPDGRRECAEWTALNPKRADARRGSFRVNVTTGLWSDFATGDGGRDLIALAAYLFGLKQDEAALKLSDMLGIRAFDD